MEKDKLKDLLKEYKKAPKEFQVANYWASYEKQVIKLIARLNLSQLRSGKYLFYLLLDLLMVHTLTTQVYLFGKNLF